MRYFAALVLIAIAGVSTSCGPSADSFPVRTYQMGEKIVLGHIIYQVFERQWLPQIGQGPDARVPQSRFCLIRIGIVNSGSGDTMVPNPTLIDDSGATFNTLSDGTGVPDWIGYLLQVHPAESLTGKLEYDVPAKHYKLRITDEDGVRAALVDIPLSFDAETPDVPVAGDIKK